MVITNNGRPIAILAAVGESNVEESLASFRRARAVDAVASIQCRSVTRGTQKLTEAEIEAEIAASRKARQG
jgi:antitoxin (DNA-binding transcriptional repressor) of toxin-antitoxin stability system